MSNKPTVLYLDDEADNLTVFKAAFRRDFRVITTTSPLEALDILEKEEIPVIITDQRMPGMTGVQFLDAIPEKNKAMRMILTGFSDVETIIHAINKCNVSQYITKPWDRTELKVIIEKEIEKFKLEKKTKEMLDNLRTSNEELMEQTMNAKLNSKSLQEFMNMISHELRTPMNGIINIANLSLSDEDEDSKAENLKQIIASGQALLEVVNTLKDKLEVASKENIINLPFKLLDISDEIINRYKGNNKNLALTIEQEHVNTYEYYGEILGNPDNLRLILDNLVSNAVKYTPEGSVTLFSEIKNKTNNNIEILFKVIDTGIGIAEAQQKSILSLFNPDKRDKINQAEFDVGLPLVKRLIRSENSELNIESELDKGSVFSFSMKFALPK